MTDPRTGFIRDCYGICGGSDPRVEEMPPWLTDSHNPPAPPEENGIQSEPEST
jgi:hypothetical protein